MRTAKGDDGSKTLSYHPWFTSPAKDSHGLQGSVKDV